MARTEKLGDLCEFIRGVTFDKAEVSIRPGTGLTPILRAGNIQDELNDREDLVWVPQSRVSAVQKLRRNDIVICMSSGSPEVVGKTAQVSRTLEASVGSFCGIIRPKRLVEAGYLSYFFRSSAFKKHRDTIARGINIQNLRFSQFEEIELDIPAEQERIAEILARSDRLRRLRRYALELGDDLLPAAFLKMFGEPKMREQWPRVELDEAAQVQGGITLSSRRQQFALRKPYLRVANVQTGALDLSEVKSIGLTEAEFAKTRLQWGDLLLVEGNGNPNEVGRAAMWQEAIPDCVHQNHLIRVRCKPDKILPEFLLALINGREGREYFLRAGKTTSGLFTISTSVVNSWPILLPPLASQRKFAAVVHRFDSLRRVHREALRQAEHLFQTLLHRAFTTGL